MSVFSVPIEFSNLTRARVERVDAWVDTGAFYTSIPRPLLEAIGVTPYKRERFMLADGRLVESDIGHMWVQVGGRDDITYVLFAEPESAPLLGALTLEALAFNIDVVDQRLVPKTWLPRFAAARVLDHAALA